MRRDTVIRDPEVLAMRLILAYLHDDPDETAFLVWCVMDESDCTSKQFEVAACAAREAASWWKGAGAAEQARRRLLAKLERLTAAVA